MSDDIMPWLPSVGMVLAIAVIALAAFVIVAIPAFIAHRRKHPREEAITVCCLASLILWPLWPVALIWAFTEDGRRKT